LGYLTNGEPVLEFVAYQSAHPPHSRIQDTGFDARAERPIDWLLSGVTSDFSSWDTNPKVRSKKIR